MPDLSCPKPPCILILAGEASGDLHGGTLASALFKKDPRLRIVGMGGPAMKKAGVSIVYDMAHLGIVGLSEIFPKALSIWQGYQTAKATLIREASLLVLIDFPDFNLRIAKIAKQLRIPVVYYITPQVWAWRKGRLKTIAERVDKALVIFPFEEEIYKRADIPCEFVGHPLLDHALPILGKPFSKVSYLREKGMDPSLLTLALLPGSRESEIKRHLPMMLDGITPSPRLASVTHAPQVFIPVAPGISVDLVRSLTRYSSLQICLVEPKEGEVYSLLRASDAAVVASGTATLEAALSGTPMVIIYTLSMLTHALVRPLVSIPWVGLVNILAQDSVVPELIQDNATPSRIRQAVQQVLQDTEKIKAGLSRVAQLLGTEGAATRAANAIYEVLMQKWKL